MKIAMVGCGALGCWYGARLSRVGQQVHFLLRSDFETVRANGLRVESPEGDFTLRPPIHEQPQTIGVVDLVCIGLKTTANDQYAPLITPLVGPHTRLLCLQNGLGNCERLATLFPAEQILGGLCFVCLNRTAPGVVRHIAFGKVVLGEFGRPAAARTREVASLFEDAGVPCVVAENLERALWEKLVWNIPFNGLGVAAAAGWSAFENGGREIAGALETTLPSDQLLDDPRWLRAVRELMAEVIAVANAKGLRADTEQAERMIVNTRRMGSYRASSILDFERGQPMELEAMFLEPLRQARATGVATPRLEALCAVLESLERRRLAQPPGNSLR